MNAPSLVVVLNTSHPHVTARPTLRDAKSLAGIVWLADTTQHVSVIGPDGETKAVWQGFKGGSRP